MMDQIFETVLRLSNKGYKVSFSKESMFADTQGLRIELCKDIRHHVECVDISGRGLEQRIYEALLQAEWEFERYFEKEKE
jgi:hypothetical protein